MTTQTRILDYHIKNNSAEQYLKGFEIAKNVIIKLKDIRELDNLVITASEYQIYDLVKVDYVVTDQSAIQAQLFKLANDVIGEKKAAYTAATNARLLPVSEIYGNNFYTYYPPQLYKNYTAQSSSRIYTDYDRFTRKDLRTVTTFYYDKVSYSGFDRVINPSTIEPAVEFVMDLQVKFQLDKGKK